VGRQHSNPGAGKAEGEARERGVPYSTCTRGGGAWTCLSCYEGSRTQPGNHLRTSSEYGKDKKKYTITAVLNQHRRDLPFVFIKRLIKNIEKFSSPFIFLT